MADEDEARLRQLLRELSRKIDALEAEHAVLLDLAQLVGRETGHRFVIRIGRWHEAEELLARWRATVHADQQGDPS